MTDARQPLQWRHALCVLVGLAAVGAPHALHLPWWIVGLVVMLIAWRAYVGYARGALPGRWLLLATALAATVGVFLTFRTIFGREAG